MNGIFQKLLLLLIAVVIFDVTYFWDAFGNIDGQGPEAGIHKLHDSVRTGDILRSISSKLNAINQLASSGDNNDNIVGDRLLSDKEKVIELQHEVEVWKGRYERAIQQKMGGHGGSYIEGFDGDLSTDHGPDRFGNVFDHELSFLERQEEQLHRVKNLERYGVDDHIVKILTAANVEIDEELAEQLPTWDDIVSMYGDKPIVYGLETCQTYRDTVKPEDRMLGPAGMFNTGTNLLFELMKVNCDIKEARFAPNVDPALPIAYREPRRNGMRWQVRGTISRLQLRFLLLRLEFVYTRFSNLFHSSFCCDYV
jgi:hypothetical protein